jgi:hypothetical protein
MSNFLLKVADVTGRQRVHFFQNLHNFVSYTSFQRNISTGTLQKQTEKKKKITIVENK